VWSRRQQCAFSNDDVTEDQVQNIKMKQRADSSVIRGRRTSQIDMPLMIPFAETRIAHPIQITFDTPQPEVAAAEIAGFANPVAAFPMHVRLMNLGMILLACSMLLIGGLFMPGSQFATSWWHGHGAGSPAIIFPSLLNHWQIAAGIIGILVVPFLKTHNRGRLALALSLSLGALLIIALLEQKTVGVPLVLMPLFGLAAMVILNAVLRARTLETKVVCLKHWQLFAGLTSAAVWSLPAYESIHGFAMRAILQTAGGPYLTTAFASASMAGLLAGALSAVDGIDKYSPLRNITARFLSSAAIVVMGGCGLVLAARIGHVSAVMQETTRWFGVGLVWLDLVINGCLLMAWSGLIERFGLVAVNRQGLPSHCHD